MLLAGLESNCDGSSPGSSSLWLEARPVNGIIDRVTTTTQLSWLHAS
jgi:hypothetical protein